MNHRQWKKNFKKKHGRNPYEWEDKKKQGKWLLGSLDVTKYTAALAKKGQAMVEVISEMCDAFAEYFERISLALGDAIEAFIETYNDY